MKMTVNLVVLLATLLFVAGAASAFCGNLVCYSVDGVDVFNPAGSFTGQIWQICFSASPATINVIPPSPPLSNPTYIAVYTDGLIRQAVGYGFNSTAGNAIYMKFHGSNNDIFTGLFSPDGIVEYEIYGIGVTCSAP